CRSMDPPTSVPYTPSLLDALPIWRLRQDVVRFVSLEPLRGHSAGHRGPTSTPHAALDARDPARDMWRRAPLSPEWLSRAATRAPDRKSTRLNSSHVKISYAVFCLK